MSEPRHPARRVHSGPAGGRYLARVLGMPGLPPDHVSEVVGYESIGNLPVRLAHVDTSGAARRVGAANDVTIVHALWCADESRSTITIDGRSPARIHPGDSVTLPAGHFALLSTGIVAIELRTQGVQPAIIGPTHGLDRFVGFNRATLCARTPDVTVERWKITVPLTLTIADTFAITNLLEPLAIVWQGGSDLLGRTASVIVSPTSHGVRLIADGRGYALVVRRTRDDDGVLDALRAAGHTDEQIAALDARV